MKKRRLTGIKSIIKPFEVDQSELTTLIQDEIVSRLDNLLIEGLKRKGYEFNNRTELIDFVQNNCTGQTDVKSLNTTTYLVEGVPFLMHVKEDSFDISDNPLIVKGNIGQYKYL